LRHLFEAQGLFGLMASSGLLASHVAWGFLPLDGDHTCW
jgi:hypothetical protein